MLDTYSLNAVFTFNYFYWIFHVIRMYKNIYSSETRIPTPNDGILSWLSQANSDSLGEEEMMFVYLCVCHTEHPVYIHKQVLWDDPVLAAHLLANVVILINT